MNDKNVIDYFEIGLKPEYRIGVWHQLCFYTHNKLQSEQWTRNTVLYKDVEFQQRMKTAGYHFFFVNTYIDGEESEDQKAVLLR